MVKLNDDIEVSEKDLFKLVIVQEFGPMKPFVCKFALHLLDVVPEYFWHVPASSSGKFHPDFDVGEGGLARHSLMAYRWLKTLLDANPTDMSDYMTGMMLAILFHDCCKLGYPGNKQSPHTLHEHPALAAKLIMDESEKFLEENKDFLDATSEDESSFKNDILHASICIYSHMGRWNTNKDSDVVLPTPKLPFEYMVHLSDYCASRKFTEFDFMFFESILSTMNKDV